LHLPRRIVSLQPSITSTLRELGVLDRIVACTKYCLDIVPELREGSRLIVADSWSAKAEEILGAQPDLVIASVPYRLESVAEIMKAKVPFLGFAPQALADIYKDIALLAAVTGVPERGTALIKSMEDEIARVKLLTTHRQKLRVFCEEWGKPLIHSQLWVAELVHAAGGDFIGTPGKQTRSEEVFAADPDVIIAAWCGAGDRVPLEKIMQQRGWESLAAVRAGRVFCINDEYLNTPGPTLLHGLHALATAIHPALFPSATGLRQISPLADAEAI
jgi:iron complex transport system substrate-binding protein